MKKKDAIERLAVELEARDQRAFERATEAAGGAATVSAVTKDYTALAKEHLDRAAMDMALERALANLDKPGPLTSEHKRGLPPAPTHKCRLLNGETFWYTPGVVAFEPGRCMQDYIDAGWTPTELRVRGYIH